MKLLLLITSARLSEIMTCRWKYINFERQVIQLPDSKTVKKEILLCQRCISILMTLKRKKDNPYVIVSSRKEGSHMQYPKKAWKRLITKAGITDARIHDLRHTNASISLQANIPIEIISKRLGHSNIKTTMRYAHLCNQQLKDATNAISDKLGI